MGCCVTRSCSLSLSLSGLTTISLTAFEKVSCYRQAYLEKINREKSLDHCTPNRPQMPYIYQMFGVSTANRPQKLRAKNAYYAGALPLQVTTVSQIRVVCPANSILAFVPTSENLWMLLLITAALNATRGTCQCVHTNTRR